MAVHQIVLAHRSLMGLLNRVWEVLVSLALFGAATGQELYQAHVYQNEKGEQLGYQLLTPKGYSAGGEERYPLVLFLHGSGERGNDNAKQLFHGTKEFATPGNREKYPCFVIVPQCPPEQRWRDVEPLLLGVLARVQRDYRVDSRRLYVTGLSMGGAGTWDLLAHHPEMFAAGAPICGRGDEASGETLKKIPIWVFHGDQDTGVLPDESRRMVAAIRKAGGSPMYTEYAGVGHDCWTQTYADPKFMEWLFAQKRP